MKQFVGYIFALLVVLMGCTTDAERTRMRSELDSINVLNRTDQPFTVQDVEPYVSFFDQHGTANDRLLAHYLLGRAFYEQGEASMALQCYHDAVECADTTNTECDYNQLSRVYGQLGYLYHKQALFSYERIARKKAMHYAYLAKDTCMAIFELEMTAVIFFLENKKDSAELFLKKSMQLYHQSGFFQNEYQASVLLMHLYAEQPKKLPELKSLINQFETKSNLFDEHHEIHSARRLYYYYVGRYYEGINMLDSAEFYYRKISYPHISYTSLNSMYKGLLSVYNKRHQSDSVFKYAQLYCGVNDSSLILKDQTLTAQMAASYKYNLIQDEARKNEAKAYSANIRFFILAFIVFFLIVAGAIARKHYIKKQEKKQTELKLIHQKEVDHMRADFANTTIAYSEKLQELQQLEREHSSNISKIKHQLHESKKEKDNYLKQKNILEEKVNNLKKRIDELIRREEIAEWRLMSIPFSETGIIKRIKLYSNDVNKHLSRNNQQLLIQTFNDFYPDLIYDLTRTMGEDTLGVYVALLVALNFSTSSISHLLDIKSTQVANLKKDINKSLFMENTARTLFYNLTTKYTIIN